MILTSQTINFFFAKRSDESIHPAGSEQAVRRVGDFLRESHRAEHPPRTVAQSLSRIAAFLAMAGHQGRLPTHHACLCFPFVVSFVQNQ